MSETDQFEQCAKDVMNLKTDPTHEEMLEVYALFKQAMVGDCNTSCPSFWDVKGRAKWNAWNSKKGVSSVLAKTSYVRLVGNLKKTYGFQ